MLQYVVVFAIVAAAILFTVVRLIGQAKGYGCHGCDCREKSVEMARLLSSGQKRIE